MNDGDVARLWTATVHELGTSVAHEVRNAISGAALNAEVVRARLASGAGNEAVRPFAESAVTELAEVARLTDALLWLVGPVPEPVELEALVGRLCVLTQAMSGEGEGGHDGAVTLVADSAGDGFVTSLEGDICRLIVARLLLHAKGAGELRCELARGDRAVAVRVFRPASPLADPPAELFRLAQYARVRVESDSGVWSLYFPPGHAG